MKHFIQHTAIISKGDKPSRQFSLELSAAADAVKDGGESGSEAAGLAGWAGRGGAAGGYGGPGGTAAGRAGNARGTPAQTRTGFCVGERVRNASGRGVWGFGTIVAIVPSGVNPRWYCRRKKLPCVFGRRSEAVHWERYVVRGDDGRHHAPRRVEEG